MNGWAKFTVWHSIVKLISGHPLTEYVIVTLDSKSKFFLTQVLNRMDGWDNLNSNLLYFYMDSYGVSKVLEILNWFLRAYL